MTNWSVRRVLGGGGVLGRGLVLGCLLLCTAACDGGRGTPQQTLETIRSALAARDGVRLYELHDNESRGFYRDQVRSLKARLDGGESDAEVLEGFDLTTREIREAAGEHQAAARLVERHSSLMVWAEWLQNATIAADPVIDEAAGLAELTLRGVDGVERPLFLVKENGAWAYDHYRTRWK